MPLLRSKTRFCFEVVVKIKLIISLFASGRLKTVEKLNFMEIKTCGILSTVKQRKNLKCEKIIHSTYKNAIKCSCKLSFQQRCKYNVVRNLYVI